MVTQIMANTTDRGFPSPSSRELVYQHTLVLTNPIQPLWRFRDSQRIGEICNQREQTTDVQTKATKGFIPVRSKEHGIAFSSPDSIALTVTAFATENVSLGVDSHYSHINSMGCSQNQMLTDPVETTITKKRSLI